MALIKTFTQEGTGIPVSYWRIKSIFNDRNFAGQIDITIQLDGYYSNDTYQAGNDVIYSQTIKTTVPTQIIIPSNDILTAYYLFIQTLNVGFNDAVSDTTTQG